MLVTLAALALAVAAPSLVFAGSPPGAEMLRSGRVDEAIGTLQKAVASRQNDAESFNLLCRAHLQLSQWDAAIRTCERAVALSPANSSYHLWLGRAYGRKAENANPFSQASLARKVREQFEKAVALNGDNLDARADLAEFYMEAPGFMGGGKAKAHAQADSIAAKDAARSLWIKGRLAEKDKNPAEAEKFYRSALQARNQPEQWLVLASFFRRQGRFGEMEAAINKAVELQKTPNNVFFDAASILWRAGRSLPQAAQLMTRYVASRNKTEEAPAFEAHYLLGQILEKQGDKAAAARQYQASLSLAQDYRQAREALKRVQK